MNMNISQVFKKDYIMLIEEISNKAIAKNSTEELYQLRLRAKQLFEKFGNFEKENLFVKIDWKIFFDKYNILMSEFEKRNMHFNKWSIDDELRKRLYKVEDFSIEILDAGEQLSLLISNKGNNILINPAIHRSNIDKNIDSIIVMKGNKEYWQYIKEYQSIPVYSSGTILNSLPPNDFHPFMKSLNFDNLVLKPIKFVDAIGVRADIGMLKIAIIPEVFDIHSISKESKNLMGKTIWICEFGAYEGDLNKSLEKISTLSENLHPENAYLIDVKNDFRTFASDSIKNVWFDKVMQKNYILKANNIAEWECECLDCGYVIKTTEHCISIKCPKCGGEMRRAERPGVGKTDDSKNNVLELAIEKPGWDETDEQFRFRVRDPDLFREGTFRTIPIQRDKPKINAVMGWLKPRETTMTIQNLMFPKEDGWTLASAKDWVTKHPDILKEFLKYIEKEDKFEVWTEKYKELVKTFRINKYDDNLDINKGVIPFRDYGKVDEDTEWDAGEEVKEADVSILEKICAWYEGEGKNKGDYKLPHHKASGNNPAVWQGVSAAMGALLGARGGVQIPAGDKEGVYNHLKKHYVQFEKEPPEFRKSSDEIIDCASSNYLPEFIKSQYSRSKCMICKKSPEYEILWADGRGRVWFCKEHTKDFVLNGTKEPNGDRDKDTEIVSIKEVNDGKVGKKWGDNTNPNILKTLLEEFKKNDFDKFTKESIDEDLSDPENNYKELFDDLYYLGNSIYPVLKTDDVIKGWESEDVILYFAKIVDSLRSVYFPISPPSLNEEDYNTPFWKLYRSSTQDMETRAPGKLVLKEWEKKREGLLKKELSSKNISIFRISKKDDKYIIGGVVYEPNVVDSQGDKATAEEIEKACYYFMENTQKFKLMHKSILKSVKILQNYIAPIAFDFNGNWIKKGTWIMVLRVLDKALWKDIVDGKITGFSMGGEALATQ